MDVLQQWPEQPVAVQSLVEMGMATIPSNYIQPPSQRPSLETKDSISNNIPVVDLEKVLDNSENSMKELSSACKDWGFFQIINHGVNSDLIERMRRVWKDFFELPMEEKKKLQNDPISYQGYGNRVGVDKDVPLDWGDYFFLVVFPESKRVLDKWPTLPPSCRETINEYSKEMLKLSSTLMKVLSKSLGLDENFVDKNFGGVEGTLRVNYYPKCPQPDLTLGLSPHSDPGGLTILLADDHVKGLQVCKGDDWVNVHPLPNAFILNLADQIQVITNGTYKSVEHRVVANSTKERFSIAFFVNPNQDYVIEPASELVSIDNPARYPSISYKEYRMYIRTKGLRGKYQVESLKSN